MSIDLLLLWWLALGVPMAWSKGKVTDAFLEYIWIGVVYNALNNGLARLSLPNPFVYRLLTDLVPFCKDKGHVP